MLPSRDFIKLYDQYSKGRYALARDSLAENPEEGQVYTTEYRRVNVDSTRKQALLNMSTDYAAERDFLKKHLAYQNSKVKMLTAVPSQDQDFYH